MKLVIASLFFLFLSHQTLAGVEVDNEVDNYEKSDAPQVDIKSSTEYENELGIKFSNCKTIQDTERRVFHSMYHTKEEAQSIYEEILNNKEQDEFSSLKYAAKGSIDGGTAAIGGDLGFIKVGVYGKDFEEAVFHLPLKILSPPVSSEFGWHLIWVDEARDITTEMPCPQLP
ncbi:MAG: peptidylprolyl isomerase [Methylophilus sp.]